MSEQAALAQVQDRLSSRYAGLSPDQVSSVVQRAHARFQESPIRDFVPLLVERRAREQLSLMNASASV